MRQRSFWVWLSAGFVAAALGWTAGGWIGSFLPRTLGASVLVAVSAGWLAGSPRRGLLAGALAGIVATVAHVLGARLATSLLAWPGASLAIVLAVVGLFGRPWARVAAVVAAPLFGLIGFALGAVSVAFVGLSLNSGQITSQLLLGGAAGFGALTLAGLHVVARWCDRPLPAAQPGAIS